MARFACRTNMRHVVCREERPPRILATHGRRGGGAAAGEALLLELGRVGWHQLGRVGPVLLRL